ncbi:hypothetical protein BIZ37_21105 [Photobacterium sp. BZF1]|uniref:pilus assembly protein TadG-related protein n=1 Tax=Photobacterium sp. BZF1 TaxID=1904457 RepID=UPI001653585F|nr:pilus assembly protein TadG-related protein [Photobacterium sp. BZF1]MBC7005067.1 hypothetical protein [Photobacterium sp. BZF1]
MQRQKGVIIPITTMALLAILAMVGLALDTGLYFNDYRQAQTAADAAALSGAFEKYNDRENLVVTASQQAATENGYTTDADSKVTVTVNHPPLSGFYQGDSNSVEVLISKAQPTFLLKAIGVDDLSYTVRAVANGAKASALNCIYVLGETTHKEAFHVSSGSSLITNCGIYVNSPHNEGVTIESGSSVETSEFSVAANQVNVSGSSLDCTNEGDCPLKNSPAIEDPFKSMPLPTVDRSNCPNISENSCRDGFCIGKYKDSNGYEPYTHEEGNVTLNPGTYCGGIFIKKGTVTFNPGTYVMRGGGLVVDGSEAQLKGESVTIYNTCYEDCSSSNSSDPHWFSPLDIKSGGKVDLTATDCDVNSSCDASLEGMLFIADPDSPSSSEPMKEPINKIDSGANAKLTGAIYVGHQHFKFHSNSAGDRTQGMIVAKYLEISSGSSVGLTNMSGVNDAENKRVTLVE